MSPLLVESIRLRMRERSDAELMEIWTTNDRVTWAPEAFEAVKSLLVERGVRDLPPQQPPAPLAERHSPGSDPVADYWLGWLRPVLWLGIAIASLNLLTAAAGLLVGWEQLDVGQVMGEPWAASVAVVRTILLPTWLMVGSVAFIRLVPVARRLLVVYAVVALVIGTAAAVFELWHQWSRGRVPEMPVSWELMFMLNRAVEYAHSLVLPTVLLVLLRRPEIRSVFNPAAPTGFEPALTNPAAAAATAPAETPPGPASPAGSSSPAAQY